MKKVGKTTGLALLLIVLAGAGEVASSRDTIHDAFLLFHELELISFKTDAPSTFKLFFSPGVPCGDKVSATVSRWNYVQKFSEQTCELERRYIGGRHSGYTTTFQALIPDNDTTQLWITLQCSTYAYTFKHYFVATGDTVGYTRGDPRKLRRHRASPKTNDPIRDTLTEEQLQTEYEVLLDLRDSTDRKIAEEILGPMSGSGKYKSCNACYILNVSLENLFKLVDEKVEFEFTTPPPWSRKYQRLKDSVPEPPPPPSPKPPKTDDIDVDTLTPEQLQREHEVVLWFRDSTERTLVEQLVGHMQDSLRLHGRWSLYRMKMSLEKFIEIRKQNVDAHLLKPRQWRYQTPKDSVPQQMPQDSVKPQGALDELHEGAYQSGWILLDHVDGLTAEGELARNQLITFYLRVINHWSTVDGLSNGFRIYSPGGAQWSTTSADTLPFGWEDMFNEYFDIRSYSANGKDEDTVAFVGIATYPSGMPLGFNEEAFTITIGPIGDEYAGKTICLDSSFYGGGGYWEWSCCGGSYVYYPVWDGPHCFTIEPNQITFSGYLYYLDPVPPDTNQMPMRRVKIEMWDDDPIDDDSLDATVTDDNGYFLLGPVENDDGWLGGGLDIFFRIYAENEAAYVTESYNGDIHRIQTPVGDDLPSGVYDTIIVAPLDSSGPFFVADAVLEARDAWLQLRLDLPPGNVQVVLEDSLIGSKYYFQENYIRIESATSFNDAWPDTYDRHVIFHEYGHKIEDDFDFFDEGGGSHSWWTFTDLMTASSEGFAHFLCNVFNNNPVCYNFYPNFTDTAWYNSENGEYGVNDSTYGSVNNYGKLNEGAVAGILWDIFDQAPDDYDGDGRGDTLWNGIDTILNVLLDRYVNSRRTENIDDESR